MHDSVHAYIRRSVKENDVAGKRVLEVGSYDVNGSIRPYIETLGPKDYVGVDVRDGPGVDRVVNCENLVKEMGSHWDLVVNCEMLEHVQDWRRCFIQLARAVKPDGRLVVTTRSPGFPYHPEPEDHWRYTLDDMTVILTALGLRNIEVEPDPLPTHPGVFASARKTVLRTGGIPDTALDDIDIHMADQPQPRSTLFVHQPTTAWCADAPLVNAPPIQMTATYDELSAGPKPKQLRVAGNP